MGKSKLKAVENQTENIETLAAKARQERQQRCGEAVQKVLDEHNCQMSVVVRIGEQLIPLAQILTLPAQALITSK